eukprot:318281-Pelagomonas_calceolata.AAC.2
MSCWVGRAQSSSACEPSLLDGITSQGKLDRGGVSSRRHLPFIGRDHEEATRGLQEAYSPVSWLVRCWKCALKYVGKWIF